MKKLNLKVLELGAKVKLTREQLKHIMGGYDDGGCEGLGTYFYSGQNYCCTMNCAFIYNGQCECSCVSGTYVPAPCGYA
jgi:hypothetical protein